MITVSGTMLNEKVDGSSPSRGSTADVRVANTPDKFDTDHTSFTRKAEPEDYVDDYPDGGTRAWLVAAGASGAFFCTLGYTNVFGIFQAYYQINQLPHEGASRIAWIGSIQAFLIFATGAVGGPLFDRYGAWVGSVRF